MPGRIGFLTGTFDPVHRGHTGLAEAAVRAFDLERVWLWVNAEPAHKTGVTPYVWRLEMARLATADSERLGVYGGELSRAPHTAKTFLRLAEDFPGAELCYIVGADTFSGIDRWDYFETVVMHTTFLLAERGRRQAREVVDEVRGRLGELGAHLRVEEFRFKGYNEASSLRVREQVRAGERPEDLDARVYRYIAAHGLYRV